ncbi:hypothetical protein COO60DRAFT_1538128 [Scenedesmus sp. NREL 46B-D3]|nr:hypothetical protein COO60DRAFT_1538128 [Scenedesmus sp. NREL 46B-D3]
MFAEIRSLPGCAEKLRSVLSMADSSIKVLRFVSDDIWAVLEDVGWCHRVLLLFLSSLGMCAMHANILEQYSLLFPPRDATSAGANGKLTAPITSITSTKAGPHTPLLLQLLQFAATTTLLALLTIIENKAAHTELKERFTPTHSRALHNAHAQMCKTMQLCT